MKLLRFIVCLIVALVASVRAGTITGTVRAEGKAEGRAEGRLESERELCAALALKHHPAVFDQTRPLIEACPDTDRLKEWALAASDLDDAGFLRLIRA